MSTPYPFQQTATESERLDVQFSLLSDPQLEELLLQSSGSILDVGCGSGVIPSFLTSHKSPRSYTGFDIQENAIQSLKNKYSKSNFDFHQQDITQLKTDKNYDLIVCRLVLWSIPNFLKNKKFELLFNLLSEGGTLYIYEPDDSELSFSPEIAEVRSQVEEWQKKMLALGLNPFIGKEILSELKTLPFSNVKVTKHRIVSTSGSPDFEKTLKNLSRIYSLEDTESEKLRLLENLSLTIEKKEITEAYYAIVATK